MALPSIDISLYPRDSSLKNILFCNSEQCVKSTTANLNTNLKIKMTRYLEVCSYSLLRRHYFGWGRQKPPLAQSESFSAHYARPSAPPIEADLYTVWLIEQLEPAFPYLSLRWKITGYFLHWLKMSIFLSICQFLHMVITMQIKKYK